MPLLSHPHERTDLKHHYGFILARQTPNGRRLARTRAHAREKSLKNFRLVPLLCRYVQRCRALAVIIPIMPTSELVWLVRQ